MTKIPAPSNYTKYIEEIKDDIIKSTQELIKIKSVKTPSYGRFPFGEGIQNALEYTLELGEKMGFRTKNLNNHAGYIEFGKGDEMVGILCHLDVVPEGENWSFDPYGGIISDGKLYGRGAMDDKGPTIASLYAMKALRDSGIAPQKRIRLILGTDEESGSKCMDYYVQNAEIPTISFSPDADFPVIHGEMGIIVLKLEKTFTDKRQDGRIKIISIKGGNAPNMVPDYAEATLIENHGLEKMLNSYNLKHGVKLEYSRDNNLTIIKAHGISAHGSTPEKGKNAIAMLLGFLDELEMEIGDLSNFISFINISIGAETDGNNLGISLKDDYNSLVLNLGVIDINEQNGSALINIRYPITSAESIVRNGIEASLKGSDIKISEWICKEPLFFKPNHPLIKALMNVYKAHTGDENAKPITIGGGTYARTIPNSVAFGAQFPGKEDTMHQKDEYIEVDDLIKITEIYASAIDALLKL